MRSFSLSLSLTTQLEAQHAYLMDKCDQTEVAHTSLDHRVKELEAARRARRPDPPMFGSHDSSRPSIDVRQQQQKRTVTYQISSPQPTRPGLSSPERPVPEPQSSVQQPGFGFPPPPSLVQPATYGPRVFSSPLGAAIQAEPIEQSQYLQPGPMVYADWKISPKIADSELAKFDGHPQNYRNWQSRIRDHLCSCNQAWGKLLDGTEKSRYHFTFHFLQQRKTFDGAQLDLPRVCRELWSFLGLGLANHPMA